VAIDDVVTGIGPVLLLPLMRVRWKRRLESDILVLVSLDFEAVRLGSCPPSDSRRGDVEALRDSCPRFAGSAMHANTAGLAHREQIDNGNNEEKRQGHLKDGSKNEGDHAARS
jgi:hypothetical protein